MIYAPNWIIHMSETDTIDRLDKKILMLLQTDANLGTAEIAEKIGLSQAPCWRRIRRLEDIGVIKKRVAILDRMKIGLPVMIFAHIKLSAHGSSTLPEFDAAIRAFPEVVECFTLMGQTDYLLKIIVPNIGAYERFFREKLSQLPAVRETNSAIALSEIKNTTALPMN
jgi:Lrp/AsnC family transcriptional regulator